MSVDIRPMHWSDIAGVHAIESEVFTVDPWTLEQFWGELAQPTRQYVVAESAGELVGYAGVYVLPPDADVQTIAVSPRGQGRGVGRRLLDDLITRAKAAGCTHLILEVRSDNAAAIGMYRSFGFEQISTRPNYYAPGVDALIMRRRPLAGADD